MTHDVMLWCSRRLASIWSSKSCGRKPDALRSPIPGSRPGLSITRVSPQKVGELPVGLDDVVVEPVFDHMQQRMSGFYQ